MPQIIAAIDFSQLTDLVIEQSERLARAFQCSITLLHVAAPNPEFVGYEAGPQSVRDTRASELAEEHQELVRQAEDLTARGLDARALLISGPTVDKILEEADRHETRYIVLGSHGHGKVYEVLVGSVCDGVVRRAACPIVIVPYRLVAEE